MASVKVSVSKSFPTLQDMPVDSDRVLFLDCFNVAPRGLDCPRRTSVVNHPSDCGRGLFSPAAFMFCLTATSVAEREEHERANFHHSKQEHGDWTMGLSLEAKEMGRSYSKIPYTLEKSVVAINAIVAVKTI